MRHILLTYKQLYFLNTGYWYFLLACAVMISSCKKNLYQNQKNENKLVVLAEITAGDSAFIPVAKSLIAGSGNPIAFEKINNASVTIAGQNETERQLRFNNASDFNSNPASIYSHPAIFTYNTGYTLKIDHPELGSVTATTHIPAPFIVKNVRSEEGDLRGKEVLNFSFDIDDAANEDNYYVFEAVKQLVHLSRYFIWQGVRYDYDTQAGKDLYEILEDEDDADISLRKDTVATNTYIRLNVFTGDAKTDNINMGSLDSSFRRIFIRDSLFNGASYSTTFSIAMDHFEAVNPQEKGIIAVRIKSVAKAFYHYMLQYEKYKTDFGTMPAGGLTSPTGNIQNGLGIFGGSCKKEWKFFYDELE